MARGRGLAWSIEASDGTVRARRVELSVLTMEVGGGEVLTLVLLAGLGWLLLAGTRGVLALARAAWARAERWELLEQPQREIDLTPLGLRRTFAVRQDFHGRCAPTADNLGTGGALWGGSLELSSFLLHEAAQAGVRLGGARVIELGAGLGLASMVVAAAAAAADGGAGSDADGARSCLRQVAAAAGDDAGDGGSRPRRLVATDGHNSVVEACQKIVEANLLGGEIEVQRLGWGDMDALRELGGGPWDVIMGSDIVYHPAPLPLLLDTVLALCGPASCVCIAYTPRGNVVARQNCDAFLSDLSACFADVATYHAADLRLSQVRSELLSNKERSAAAALSGGGDFTEVGTGCVMVFRNLLATTNVAR